MVRAPHDFHVRLGYGDRARDFRIGRNGVISTVAALGLLFAALTHFLYDYRENMFKVRDLSSLRQRVSEQNMTLYDLHSKFESLEIEVERLRTIDARVRSVAVSERPSNTRSGKAERAAGVGGKETQEVPGAGRLDHLLDLRLEQLRKDILVDVKDLEILYEKMDRRRTLLESAPSLWPVRGMLSSGFGIRTSPFTDTKVFHHGLDIIGKAGTPVKAASGGRVVRSGYESLFGNIVIIDHGHGYRTLYAHLGERNVTVDDIVDKGDYIGSIGATGRTTGPHLHYEVHVNGLPVNPSRFLN